MSTIPEKFRYQQVSDGNQQPLPGLWVRNGRFYAQMHVQGKGTRRIALLDEQKAPVRNITQAKAAQSRVMVNRQRGETQGPRITPTLKDYANHYISWLEKTKAKNLLTIKKEKSSLKGWQDAIGSLRLFSLNRIHINDYVLKRVNEDKVTNRSANLDVMTLDHLLEFAKEEGILKGELPTTGWKPLKYKAPRRSLVSVETIEAICTEAVRLNEDGESVYGNGKMLADLIKLLAYSGARRKAGLSAKWSQVDWGNRQLTLFTKYEKTAVIDFNEKLEAHLRDMYSRRNEGSQWIFPTPRLLNGSYMANPQKVLDSVTAAIGLTGFRLHDLRSFFISHAVMGGVDVLSVAKWVSHADGGVLIGKTYGHLNPGHLRDSATKVTFAQQEKAPAPETPQAPSNDVSNMSVADLLAALQAKLAQPPVTVAAVPTQPASPVASPRIIESTLPRAVENLAQPIAA